MVKLNKNLEGVISYALEVVSWIFIVALAAILLTWLLWSRKHGAFRPWRGRYEYSNEDIVLVVTAANTFDRAVTAIVGILPLLGVTLIVVAYGLWRSRVFVSVAGALLLIGWFWILLKTLRLFGSIDDFLEELERAVRTHCLRRPFKTVNGSPPYSLNSTRIITPEDRGDAEDILAGRRFDFILERGTGDVVLFERTPRKHG